MKSTVNLSITFRLFLQGKDKLVLETLIDKMDTASRELRFEQAAAFRDQIQAIRRVQEQQYVSDDSMEDMDVLGLLKRMA